MEIQLPASILTFPEGLPGFEAFHRFALTAQTPPLMLLRSVDRPELSFHAIPVSVLDSEYQLGIAPDDLRLLDLNDIDNQKSDLLCLAILAASEDGAITANLLAPVIVNLAACTAVQAVRSDARYSHRHPVIAGSCIARTTPGSGSEEAGC